MDNVPVRVNSPAHAGRSTTHPSQQPTHHVVRSKKSKKLASIIIGIIFVLLAIGAGGWFVYQASAGATIDRNKYQAVFFTNGQVYFGKLQAMNSGYFKLIDIFYLQAKSTQPNSQNPQASASNQSSDVQLVKLGGEVHGPTDEMVINKDQVLFFENLKSDGKVSQSIDQYKKK
jgi:hypothetical protein